MWNPEAWYLHKIYWHASVVAIASPSSRPHPHKHCPNFLVDKDSGAQNQLPQYGGEIMSSQAFVESRYTEYPQQDSLNEPIDIEGGFSQIGSCATAIGQPRDPLVSVTSFSNI